MDVYNRLQADRKNGDLTDAQFKDALSKLQWSNDNSKKKKKQVRRQLISKEDKARRTELRTLTKWIFDVELDRVSSPLFNGVGDRENLVLMEFLPLTDKVIKYATNAGLVSVNSTKNRDDLVQTIMALILNRRKNLRNSRKVKPDGTRKLKPLRLIYFYKSQIIVTGDNGESVVLHRPEPLPSRPAKTTLDKKVSTPATVTTRPPLSTATTEVPPAAECMRIVEATATALPVTTAQEANIDNDPQSSDEDILDLQQKMMEMQRKMQRLKQKKQAQAAAEKSKPKPKQQVHQIVQELTQPKDNKEVPQPTSKWMCRLATTSAPKITTMTCRNSLCGKDFDTTTADDQNGAPVLCNECWESEKESILNISSSTGSKKKRKLGTLKTKKNKKQRPSTPNPKSNDMIKRTVTPPNPMTTKKYRKNRRQSTTTSPNPKFEV